MSLSGNCSFEYLRVLYGALLQGAIQLGSGLLESSDDFVEVSFVVAHGAA